MFSRASCLGLVVVTIAFFTANIGCDSRVSRSTSSSGKISTAKNARRDSSTEDVPGPQTEPPLSKNTGPTTKSENTSTEESDTNVRVVDREGFDVALAKHKGEVVLVDYWATWCGPCRKKFPHTVALAKEHKSDGLAVITVSMDDDEDHEEVVKFLADQQANFDNLRSKLGKSDESFESFGIPGGSLPCLRLFDREGKLIKTFAFDENADKQFTDEDVAEAVKTALAK